MGGRSDTSGQHAIHDERVPGSDVLDGDSNRVVSAAATVTVDHGADVAVGVYTGAAKYGCRISVVNYTVGKVGFMNYYLHLHHIIDGHLQIKNLDDIKRN